MQPPKLRERETEYVVFRHGSNAANQSMTPVMPVGIYTGRGVYAEDRREDAKRQAAEEVTVYANQYLSTRPYALCRFDVRQAAREEQAANQRANEEIEAEAEAWAWERE